MLPVSDQQFLLILKTCLKFSFVLIGLCYIVITLLGSNDVSVYEKKPNATITGVISEITWQENRVMLVIGADEKIIVFYNFDNELARKKFQQKYQIGFEVLVKGSLERPPEERVFHLFNYRRYLKSQQIFWFCQADEITLLNQSSSWAWRLKQAVIDRIDNLANSRDYVANFVLNEREITDEAMTSYQKNGVIHLLAISGTHIAFLILVLRKIKLNDGFILLFLATYLFVTGFAISLLRAVLFYCLMLLKQKFNWLISAEKLLLLLAFGLLLYNPFYIYDIGFQFSFIISFFLIHFSYVITMQKTYLGQSFMVSLIAFFSSLPILVSNFFAFNLWTPLINLIFVPLFSVIIYPLTLLTFLFSGLDAWLWQLILLVEALSAFFAEYAIILVIPQLNLFWWLLYYLVIYCFFYYRRFWNFALLVGLLVFYKNITFFNPYGVVTFIDVGQGDAILIETPRQAKTILIDTGGVYFPDFRQFLVANRIMPYLKARGIDQIDLLVLTHGHYDHLGEAKTLLKKFPVAKVVLNQGSDNQQEKRLIAYMDDNEIPYKQISEYQLTMAGKDFFFLNNKDADCENEDSLVLYTVINDHPLLFMGDAGFPSEHHILQNYQLDEVSVLKVGHHGSRYSSGEEFLATTNPQAAIITVGSNNRFNHPHQAVLKRLQAHDINYYLTSKDGSIKIFLQENLKILTTKKGNK